MTRLENVINQVKVSRTGKNHAWIFDDGKISDNVVCGEVLDLLEELKEYEINVSDAWIENFLHNPRVKGDNTYNFNANISNDINIDYLVLMMELKLWLSWFILLAISGEIILTILS